MSRSAASKFKPSVYKANFHKEFDAVLRAAEQKNQLYYLFVLYNLWGMHPQMSARASACSMDFNAEINRITKTLVLDRMIEGQDAPTLPQDLLFVFLLNIEQKGFYAVLRNFVRITMDRYVCPEPWETDEWGQWTNLKTGKIIRNLHREIEEAGFTKLAEEFLDTHTGDARTVRNAIAHGNFRIPAVDTGGKWVFGDYVQTPKGGFGVETKRFSAKDINRIAVRLLSFRLAFFQAAGDHQRRHVGQEFDFQAANQKERSQILDCQFNRGTVTVKYRGTPLW